MGIVVVTGAQLTCPFGTAPSALNVTSNTVCLGCSRPVATIMDVAPANIPPFGACTSMANPQVAAATAANRGILTPQPCVLVAAGTWIPTKPTVLVGGKPVLTNDAKLICGKGMGSISVISPGQATIMAG